MSASIEANSVESNPIDVNDIIAYESDQMTEEEEIIFFQKLINNGMAWSLQGHYGRQASYLIEAGFCKPAQPLE